MKFHSPLAVVLATLMALCGPLFILLSGSIFSQENLLSGDTQPKSASISGPLRIVKLLWKSNSKNAADTLTKSISTALDRRELTLLRAELSSLGPQFEAVLVAADRSDPRFCASLAAAMLCPESLPAKNRELVSAQAMRVALEKAESVSGCELLWRAWLTTDPVAAQDYFASSLASDPAQQTEDSGLRAAWQATLIREALSRQAVPADRERATGVVLTNWSHVLPSARLAAIESLTATAPSMQLLLEAVKSEKISKDSVNPNQLRKWLASENTSIIADIETVWGKVRRTDDVARQELVAGVVAKLGSGVSGSASRGAIVFDRVCSQCHVLHGRGFEVGPNIMGNGRGNLPQLVSNILDPSLVIGEAFQAKTVLTVDGQIVAGLVVAESDRYLKLKIQGGKIVEFDKQDIEQVKASTKSLMPEGVEEQMQEQELFDLLSYLCLLKPLGVEGNELIPGTPENFVLP